MGRDHTIYATQCGYVKYYKDPEKNPKRQYIGVVFERDQVLPLPRNSVRRRRLGMEVRKIELPVEETLVEGAVAESVEGVQVLEGVQKVAKAEPKRKERRGEEGRNLTLSPVGYMYREANWQIGRAAERAKVKVREFTPRDRWTAWRKSAIRKGKNLEKRRLGRSLGGKKKEKK
jgi:large subunit ribosomal protein L27